MEDNGKITKIVVGHEDEITDIVTGILNAQTQRVILTFAEQSDILISAINLSVLKETAEEEGKTLIAQIIKNPTGQRNSKIAGITTIDTPNNPTEEDWIQAQKVEDPIFTDTKDNIVENNPAPQVAGAVPASNFEKRINEAIQKSRAELDKKKDSKTIHQDGIIISVGEDLPTEEEPSVSPNLANIDFKDITKEEKHTQLKKPLFVLPNIFKPKVNDGSVIHSQSPFTRKLRRFLPIFLISLIFIAVLVGVIYFNTGPFVKVRIFVKAQEVSIEKTFTGDSNIKEIDFDNLKIPIKTETVEEARSATVTATGKAYKGEKATGSVTLTHKGTDPCGALALPAGQVIISSDSKTYSLNSAVSIECNSLATVSVQATEIGEEYNTPQGTFSVQNYSKDTVEGFKTGTFSGGTKTEYTVLSLSDVNTASDALKTSSISEAEQALKDKQGEWTLIADSMKSEIKKDSIKTDIAVGAEASQANLSLTVASSATYYFNNGFDQGVANLLTKEAQTKNLFQNSQNLELTLGDNIEKEVSVVQNTDSSVLIKLTAKGSVQPKIDKAAIINNLKGKKWADGAAYLDSLKYSDKPTLYEFNPVNFPKSLYYFPKRQGGILVEIVDI